MDIRAKRIAAAVLFVSVEKDVPRTRSWAKSFVCRIRFAKSFICRISIIFISTESGNWYHGKLLIKAGLSATY